MASQTQILYQQLIDQGYSPDRAADTAISQTGGDIDDFEFGMYNELVDLNVIEEQRVAELRAQGARFSQEITTIEELDTQTTTSATGGNTVTFISATSEHNSQSIELNNEAVDASELAIARRDQIFNETRANGGSKGDALRALRSDSEYKSLQSDAAVALRKSVNAKTVVPARIEVRDVSGNLLDSGDSINDVDTSNSTQNVVINTEPTTTVPLDAPLNDQDTFTETVANPVSTFGFDEPTLNPDNPNRTIGGGVNPLLSLEEQEAELTIINAENRGGPVITEPAPVDDLVFDDELGEFVPREELAGVPGFDENPTGPLPVDEEVVRDGFGCLPGETYDDESLVCVPSGRTIEGLQEGGLDDFGCKIGLEFYDDENGICVPNGKNASDIQQPPPSKPVPKDVQEARRKIDKGDWRVRLSLAPNSEYLYNDPFASAGILGPLIATDGIIFPYMPKIDQTYYATYSSHDLTHSNYRGYFYQNSYPAEVIINAKFTAQDTKEANYMLAVVHFLRSCTKMFYGQDSGNPHRGAPPPLLFLRGLGEFQYNEHPCAVTMFNYNLPDDVDYIKAGDAPATNFDFLGGLKNSGHRSWSSKISRLLSSGLSSGAQDTFQSSTSLTENNQKFSPFSIAEGATYVPTTLDIQFTLLPIQTRKQVSQQYSNKYYGYGTLTRKGFW